MMFTASDGSGNVGFWMNAYQVASTGAVLAACVSTNAVWIDSDPYHVTIEPASIKSTDDSIVFWECAYCGRLQDKENTECLGCSAPKRQDRGNAILVRIDVQPGLPPKADSDRAGSDGFTFWATGDSFGDSDGSRYNNTVTLGTT